MMQLAQILAVSTLVEAIWETLKMTWAKGKLSYDRLGALIISIAICLVTKADLFPLIGIEISIGYIGSVLTGIIASRGANFVHDIYKKVEVRKEEK